MTTNTKTQPVLLNGPAHILWFDDFDERPTNRYRFLSNFYVGDSFMLPAYSEDDQEFATGEHAYQAYKAADPRAFKAIAEAETPGKAKSMGRNCTLRPDWEEIKYDVMIAILRTKFQLDRDEGQWLLDTGDRLLMEGTYWRDRVWGVDLHANREQPTLAPGRNWLGTLLMARRAELRAEQLFGYSVPTSLHNYRFFATP